MATDDIDNNQHAQPENKIEFSKGRRGGIQCKAEHIALQNIFPSATIRGCLFHWKKTLIEHFDKIIGYKTDNTVKDILHAASGVVFVPIEHVELTRQHIKRTLQAYPSTVPFIEYFERSWLYNPNLHPHHLWNYYNAVLQDQKRTNNNHFEGSNNALNNAAACSTPSAARLMDILKKFNTDAELAVLHSVTGKPPTPKQKPANIDINKRLKKTVESFTPANILFYCRALGHLNYINM